MFENVFNGMFGKIAPGMCRLSMSGAVAVKTSNGYKTYNVKSNRLVNCSNFVFPVGEEFFFCIPTNKVAVGDIILIGGKPKCVISQSKGSITVLNYEDSTIDTVVPERHMFMGSTYFYGKITSLFNFNSESGKKNKTNQLMKYMVMSEMFGGAKSESGFGNMLPLMLMSGNSDLFNGMFDFGFDDVEEAEESDEDISEEEDN